MNEEGVGGGIVCFVYVLACIKISEDPSTTPIHRAGMNVGRWLVVHDCDEGFQDCMAGNVGLGHVGSRLQTHTQVQNDC